MAEVTGATRDGDLEADLQAIALRATQLVGCDAVGITLVVLGRPTTLASIGRIALELDLVQYGCAEGPCLDAIRFGQPLRVDLVREPERFRHFAPGALDRHVRGVASIPITTGGRTVGSLNLYSTILDQLPDATMSDAAALADEAGRRLERSNVLWTMQGLADQLQRQEDDVVLLTTAEGILISRTGVTVDEASRRLLQAAADLAVDVVAIARMLVDSVVDELADDDPEDDTDDAV